MAGVNKVIIIGYLGGDPEVRYLPDGTACCNFSVATSQSWTDKNTGEKRENTEWHKIVTWRTLAENCGKYLAKGRQVYVEGSLKTRKWEQDGITCYATDIVAVTVQFLGGGNNQGRGQDGNRGRQHESYGDRHSGGYPEPPQPSYPPTQDDDIPF